MSGNNSIEIVTQKELEGVLGNKTFNVDQFLKVYEEWKQTHDTGSFALLRSMHQNAGYKNKNMIFGSESEMHEIAAIVKKFKDGKVEISTTVTAGTAAVAATNSSPRVASGSSVDSSDIETEYKYSLEKYASFATRELGKSGKTIKDLQEKLVEKKCYSGEITGKFDQAMLEAVIKFQKSVPNIKYGPDGLVGPVTIGELFGIATPSNVRSSRRGDNESDGPRSSTGASVATVRSSHSPADIQPEANNSISDIHKELTKKYTHFTTYASKIDKWFGAVRDSKDNVDTQRTELNNKIEILRNLFSKYENHPETSIRNTIAAYRINLSYYLVNDLEGIGNNLNKNVIVSQNLAIAVLNQDKKRIEPIPEGKQAIFNTLDSIKNTPLGNTIAEALQKNPDKDIYEIISNPTIKGGWESAYSKIFDTYLSSLDTAIDTTEKDSTLTTHQKKALHHLKDIRGKNGWYDLKTEHTTAMWQGVKLGGAVIAGAAATYISAGTLGPLAAAGVGAVVATGGTSLARGYWDGRETLIDGGINLLSFGGGALVVKLGQAARGTQAISSMGKVGTISTGIAIDGVGNIGIGVAGDSLRAHLHGEDLNTWDSLKMNAIPWAIFALVMNARGVKVPQKVLEKAKDVEKSVAHAEATAHVGGSPKADLDNIAAKGPELEKWGQTQQNNPAHIVPPEHSGAKPNTNLHGDPIAPNPISAKPNQARQIQIENNMNLSDSDRISKVNKELGITMNSEQEKSLILAHNTGNSPLNLRKKVDILSYEIDGEQLFTTGQRRVLIEEGYVGKSQRSQQVGQQTRSTNERNVSTVSRPEPTHSNNHDTGHGGDHVAGKSSYKFEGWKTIDKILMGDNRKFREIFPLADNNVWKGAQKLSTGEMKISEAIHNSAAWVQNQTFSQIYTEMAKPWKGNTSAFLKNSIDNVRTLLISGESGKWMSKDRLGKLGIIVGATTLDYMTSEEGKKNSDGLLDAIGNGIGFTFQKYAMNPQETLKLYQEIILLNWVAIMIQESRAIAGAAVGVTSATVHTLGDRLK